MKLPMGTEVVIRASLRRTGAKRNRFWVADEFPSPLIAYWIGYRTVHDGHMNSDDEFISEESYEVNLVALHPRENPVYVLDSDLQVMPK